jgi:AbrB family looped-hinge helix DNA binding protein
MSPSERLREVPDGERSPEGTGAPPRTEEERRSVDPKGRVTIPVAVRRLLGVEAGGTVSFSVRDGDVVLRAVRSPLDQSFRAIPALSPHRTWKEIKRLAAEDRAERLAREGLE